MLIYGGLDTIDVLGLSTRSHNALRRAKIVTIQDLLNFSGEDMGNIKFLGQKSLSEILAVIDNLQSETIVIESGKISQLHQSTQSFIGLDGKKYYDMALEKLDLSVRAFNCLKNAGVNHFSELILKTSADLIDIPNMGKGTLGELLQVQANTKLSPCDELEDDFTHESVCHALFMQLNEKINVNAPKIFNVITPICKKYLDENIDIQDTFNCLNDKVFMQSIYESDYIQEILKTYILNILENHIYGCSQDSISENMPTYFDNSNLIEKIIEYLTSHNKIELFNNDSYIISHSSFVEGAKELLSEKEYKVLIQRTENKTLEEIGQEIDVTRERIRQIEAKSIRKLNKNGARFKEDIFSNIFQKYYITSEDFLVAFKNTQTHYYLSLRYTSKDSKLPLEQILEDKAVPPIFKRAFEKAIYKNFVQIGKEYVPCTRPDISNYVLRTFATEGITFDEFSELYYSTLEDIGKESDTKLSVMDRGYENRVAASKIVLWKFKKRFRYYNMEQYDFAELLSTLKLGSYLNVEYSALKFLRLYPEVMHVYDIRDEYELHNLLKKICSKEDYPSLTFNRMPNIEFGVGDRDNQVMELLLSLSPISNDDLAKEYESEYGVVASTVLANYVKKFDEYLYNGMYKINFPTLPNDIAQKFKQILVNDFYLLSDIRTVYKNEFPNYDKNLLNPFSLKALGFKVYSNYAVSDKFSSASGYFTELLTKDAVTYIDNFPPKISEVIGYTSQLYKLKSEYEIIEFSPNKYISFRKLQEKNISKTLLVNFCTEVLNFAGDSKYFTMQSLRKDGFSHELDNLGFDDWFYISILVEDKEHLSYQRVGGNKLMLSGTFKVRLEDFIEHIIFNQDSLSMDVYEMSELLDLYYGLKINTWKLIQTTKNSSLFYDAVTEKIYADYDVYYEEI